MLRNLRAEMVRKDIKPIQIAELLGVRYATVIDKLNGRYDFSFNDALKIKKQFFDDMDMEYLFKSEKNKTA